MTATESERAVDYARLDYQWRQWYERFKRRAESDGLTCQECGGSGGEAEPILDDGSGPWTSCGWCVGTGYMTKHRRGEWLRWKREEKANLREKP